MEAVRENRQETETKTEGKQMKYNDEIKTMEQLDSMYMAAIRAHLKCQTRFSKGQVAGVELAYIALNLPPVGIIEVDVDDIFRGE